MNGHLHVLQWIRDQKPPCPWDRNACSAAAKNGHLDVIKWLRSQDPPCPWNSYTCRNIASRFQYFDVVQWVSENM
jgi:hypothetical protein